jgi:hypothetical protein
MRRALFLHTVQDVRVALRTVLEEDDAASLMKGSVRQALVESRAFDEDAIEQIMKGRRPRGSMLATEYLMPGIQITDIAKPMLRNAALKLIFTRLTSLQANDFFDRNDVAVMISQDEQVPSQQFDDAFRFLSEGVLFQDSKTGALPLIEEALEEKLDSWASRVTGIPIA